MASANLLGKLLAAYLSTSNDTLAVSFRAHYAANISPAASVSSHFVDVHGRLFTHLNSQRTPLKAQQAIDQLAELLNAAIK